jgi:magnesium transporter
VAAVVITGRRGADPGMTVGVAVGVNADETVTVTVTVQAMSPGALTLIVVTVPASASGSLVPIALGRLRFDPAVATGVFITTSDDVVGVLVFFVIATSIYLRWRCHA